MHRYRESLVVALFATLLATATAMAATNVQVTRSANLTFDGRAFAVTLACGFEVELHTVGKAVDIERYDKDGNLVSYIAHSVWNGYLLNPVNGKTVESKVAGPTHVRYLDDGTIVETGTGAIYIRTVPGSGLVSAFVGRVSATLTPTGEFDEEGFPIYDVLDESFNGQWSGNGGVCEYLL